MASLSVAQVLTDTDLGISAGFADVLYATIGGRSVLYALNRAEGRVYEMSVMPDGTLVVVDHLTLAGDFSVGSDPALTLFAATGSPSLLVSGLEPAVGNLVALGANGALGVQVSAPVFGELTQPVVFSLDGTDAVLNGASDSSVDLYLSTGAGFQFADSLSDTPESYLADINGGTAVIEGSTPLVAVASSGESGVSVLRIDLAGTISLASSFGVAEGLPISTPSDLVALSHGGTDRLVLASSGTSSLTVLRVEDDGALMLEDHVLDSASTRFQSITALDAFVTGDHTFVAAGGGDGGLSLFTLLANGRLVHLGSVVDTAATSLYRISSVSISATTTMLNIAATSQWEAGITRLSYDLASLGAVLVLDAGDAATGTSGDDQIIGTDVADTISGGAGDDILFDGAGEDLLFSGVGSDLFVFAADGQRDRIEGYDPSDDRLDLSAWDFLGTASQLTITPTANGAVLSFGEEVIEIISATGGPLSAPDFNDASVLNIDRPSFLEIPLTLTGGRLADTLNGGQGADTIKGGDGSDWLTGAGGFDVILGGNGNDRIDGGASDDQLEGGGGADTIAGGSGDDRIDGGAGGDVLYGDDFDWVDPI